MAGASKYSKKLTPGLKETSICCGKITQTKDLEEYSLPML